MIWLFCWKSHSYEILLSNMTICPPLGSTFIKCECQQWNYWLAYVSLIWRSLKEVFEINRKESRPMLVFIVQIYVHWIMSEKSMKINSCCVFSSSWPRLVSKWLENLGTDRSSRCDEIDNQSLILIYVRYHHHDWHVLNHLWKTIVMFPVLVIGSGRSDPHSLGEETPVLLSVTCRN